MDDPSVNTGDKPTETSSLAPRYMELVSGSWMAQAAYVAAELGIADLLAAGPKTCEQLAEVTGTHAPSLTRLLRALSTIDVCRQREDGLFELAPLGACLRADGSDSLRSWTIWWGQHMWPLWSKLLYSVRTGQSARKLLLGTEGFEHLQRDPEAAAIFHRAAAELTRLSAEQVVRAYDFSALKRVVDVGGGCGELLACILRSSPSTEGVLFEQPHAIEAAMRHLQASGLASRCQFVAGDFFESVPAGADAYVLKSVIHDWDDERSRRILENCRQALADGGRLLLVEEVLPSRPEVSSAHQAVARSDLNMLITHAGRERTASDLQMVLRSASWQISRIFPAGLTFSIVEAFPAPHC